MDIIKSEIIGKMDETLVEDSQMREDGDDFILPSQPASERSSHSVSAVPTQEAYLLPTADNRDVQTMIDESVNVTDASIDINLVDTTGGSIITELSPDIAMTDKESSKLRPSEDLFGPDTEPYNVDESSVVPSTPLFDGRSMVPETPMQEIDSDDDSFLNTPHLSLNRLVTQSQAAEPVLGTSSQLADTQPVDSTITQKSTTGFGEIDLTSPAHQGDISTGEFKIPRCVPEILNKTADSSIEEIPITFNEDVKTDHDHGRSISNADSKTKTICEDETLINDQKNDYLLDDCKQTQTKQIQNSPGHVIIDIDGEEETSGEAENKCLPEESLQNARPLGEGETNKIIQDRTLSVESHDSPSAKAQFSIFLEVFCNINYDKTTHQIFEKKIVKVREKIVQESSELTDKSKRESMSSAGSVYSDKQGLPYQLQNRISIASNQTSSTSTVEENMNEPFLPTPPEAFKPWKNDCLISLECDKAMKRFINQPNINLKRTPHTRLSLASQVLFDKLQNGSCELSSREHSMEEMKPPQHSVALNDSNINSLEREEQADTVPPLPISKSTPKRSRRPPRSKAKAKAVKNKKSNLNGSEVEGQGLKEEKLPKEFGEDSTDHQVAISPVNCTSPVPAKETFTKQSNKTVSDKPTPPTRKRTGRNVSEVLATAGPSSVKRTKLTPQKKAKSTNSSDLLDSYTDNETSKGSGRKAGLRGAEPVTADKSGCDMLATPGPSGLNKTKATPQKMAKSASDLSESCTDSDSVKSSRWKRGHSRPASATPRRRSNTPPSQVLSVGAPVFARWSDNFFYTGTIKSAIGNKWDVEFADGNRKTVASHFIVGQSSLRAGHAVMVKTKDTYYPAMVISQPNCDEYLVEVGGKERVVKGNELGLTAEQAKTVNEDETSLCGTPSAKLSRSIIDLDNILSDRRDSRRGLVPQSPSELSSTDKRKRKISAQFELTSGLERDEMVLHEEHEPIVPKSVPKSRKNAMSGADLAKTLGPIPSEPIFAGMCFLLCHASLPTRRRPSKKKKVAATDSEVSMSESEDLFAYDKYDKFPFDAERLKSQVAAGGGKLYDRFEDVPVAKYSHTRLVTNRPNRSAKFLLCLVHGIDIILHLHVIDACKGKDFKSMKLHHAGWSELSQRWIDRPAKLQKSFAGKQICVSLKRDDSETEKRLHSFWTTILKKSGATLVNEVDYADIILTDSSISETVRDVLGALGNSGPTLVSTNWVIESIIHGYPVEQDGHVSFRYDYETAN